MIKAVLVDMDNTLIKTQVLFREGAELFGRFVCGMGPFELQDIIDHYEKHQMVLFPSYGYSAAIVPQAMEDTLRHFVPDATEDEIAYARSIGRRIYERQAEVKEGVEAAIAELSRHYPIYLVTVGDLSAQQARVDALPFKDIFAGIYIVEHKNAETYRAVLAENGIKPEEAVMIGDSIKSDIIPAVENGMSAIYIPADNWIAREMSGVTLPSDNVTTHVTFTDAVHMLVSAKPVRHHRPVPPVHG